MTTVGGQLAAGLLPPERGHPLVSRPVDGFRLAYDRCGTGPAVVLLHGGHGDRTDWTDVAVSLRGTVVAPDLRGVGESDRWSAGDVSVPAQARSVAGLIDELRIGSVVVAGYGIGAAVALELATRRPGRVSGLVITPPPAVPPRATAGPLREVLARAWTRWSGPNVVDLSTRLDHLVTQSDRRLMRMSAPLGRGDVVTIPTTILWPLLDPLVRPSFFDRLSDRFTRVTVRGLPGVGHFVPVEQPRALVGAIHEMIEGRRARHGS